VCRTLADLNEFEIRPPSPFQAAGEEIPRTSFFIRFPLSDSLSASGSAQASCLRNNVHYILQTKGR
jgi:hypothetical protein